MNKSNVFAFYGSLRPGHYNFARLALDKKAKPLGTFRIPGYSMYSLGAYPFIVEDSANETGVVIDVFEITEDYTKYSIINMETGAGYKEKTLSIDGVGDALIFYKELPKNIRNAYPRIESGDWTKHRQENDNC